MRNKIFGGIGILWGGGMVVRWLATSSGSVEGAYNQGSLVAMIFGLCMLAAGIYTITKKPKESSNK